MANAVISHGPKLGLLNNAAIDEMYYNQFRPFLRGIDALVQASVLNIQSAPPSSPANGDAYIVQGGTGLWAGNDNNLAVYSTQVTLADTDILTSGWDFYIPQPGWVVYCVSDRLFHYVNSSGTWVTALATTSVAGSVIPDGTTIKVNSSGVISASVPTTTVAMATTLAPGIVKPDGTTITISEGTISAVSPTIPTATTSVLGLVKVDGTSVTINSGVISASGTSSPTATSSTLGLVKPDNSTITIDAGVITAVAPSIPTATNSTLGVVKPDGSTVTISSGVLSAVNSTATSSTLGVVRPDNTTITVNSGVISAVAPTVPTATSSILGIVKPDGTSLTINNGVLSLMYTGTSGSGVGWGAPPGTGSAGGLFVQAMGGWGGTSYSPSTFTFTLSSPVTAGNSIVVAVSGPITGVTDSLGNAYVIAPYSGGGYSFYICNRTVSSGVCTLTISMPGVAPTSVFTSATEYTPFVAGDPSSIVIAGAGGLSAFGPTSLSSQSLVIFHGAATPTSLPFTQRFIGTDNMSTWDIIVNAGSLSFAASGEGSFIAIRTS